MIEITLTDDQVQSVLSQEGTVATLKAQVAQLTADKATLQSQLDAATAANATLTESVATLTTDRDAQKARADTAEQRLAQLNTDIDAVQAKD